MLIIEVCKVQFSGFDCDNPKCLHSPKYFDHIMGDNYYLKRDIMCVHMRFERDDTYHIYCMDCAGSLYKYVKTKLDPKLQAFQ